MNCTECLSTCDSQNVACDQNECTEGCGCPEGQVLENDRCVDVNSCGCKFNEQTYKNGMWIRKDCNYWWDIYNDETNCNLNFFYLLFSQCKAAKWHCTTRSCPATCSAYGDPHYQTFDGRKYEFHGDCTYVLAEDYCGDELGNFRITVENVPCSTGGLTCTKSVKVGYIWWFITEFES